MDINPLEALRSLFDIIFNFDVLRGFVLTMWKFFTSLQIVQLVVTATLYLLVSTLLCCISILFLPRLMEDYIRLYNWYVNSDFYDLFARKVNVRPIIVLLLLPIVLFVGILFATANLVVSISYRIIFKVLGLRCFYCGYRLKWETTDLQCDHCATRYSGTADSKCPLCGFKPNAVHCPSCAHLIFVGLEGSPPNPNIIR